ncbi:MAG: glycosyltransferase family 2 protein, partial [Parvularculaceae bacterium]|nr:glycosyltransferase family 2 protein [Parvularculaceae bacterium]
MTSRVGFVAIGRNEGERLVACLKSLGAAAKGPIVYVDSGSTDDSVARAVDLGADVVRLDMSVPFTAARARNAGAARQRDTFGVDYIQFIDGDCALAGGWIETARAVLDANSDVAAVCGRRREIRPDASVYNRLCDIEWDTPIGDAQACGGDVMMRADAFFAVGGYRASLIAGEEPELCLRLREKGLKIVRLDADMT